MRLGVLDVGGNAVHLPAVDLHRGSDATEMSPSAAAPDGAAGTSKTFRSFNRLTGEAPTASSSSQFRAFGSRITAADRAESRGVGSPHLVAGALVAEASMRALSVKSVEICPSALREGLIVRKLDTETDGDLVGSSR